MKNEAKSLIEKKIITIRNCQVMIDRDLAELYQVETKVLNQAVKRNINRFPEAFRFQLTEEEVQDIFTSDKLPQFQMCQSIHQIQGHRL
jgi:hypothetical protein